MSNNTPEIINSNAYVLDSTTLLASPSSSQKIEAKSKGITTKIPVTIAQPKVQIYVDTVVKLPVPVLAITNVSRNVILTRSLLLPTDDKKSSKLLLAGYVRKIIQYAIPSSSSSEGANGNVQFSSFDFPFKCFAKVDYLAEPDMNSSESPIAVQNADENYFGADQSEYSFVNSHYLNEKIHCELIEAKVREIGIKNNPADLSAANSGNALFETISESMVVELLLRIIQNQQVSVPASEEKKSEGSGKGKKH